MSVMECDRTGCENVMCSTIINNKYVCDDCLAEFEHANKYGSDKSFLQHAEAFNAFMKTEPAGTGRLSSKFGSVKDFLDHYRK